MSRDDTRVYNSPSRKVSLLLLVFVLVSFAVPAGSARAGTFTNNYEVYDSSCAECGTGTSYLSITVNTNSGTYAPGGTIYISGSITGSTEWAPFTYPNSTLTASVSGSSATIQSGAVVGTISFSGTLTAPSSPGNYSISFTDSGSTSNPYGSGTAYYSIPISVLAPPTSSVSVSQNPVPYGGNPGFTLSSTNGYYCYVRVDGADLSGTPGYFASGTFYYGTFTSPGSHYVQSYCFNTAWAGSGWSTTYFTVSSPPTSSVSVSPNPVPYGGNPGITLGSTNGYYCHVYVDWANVASGYFTSGTYYPGAQYSPGTHSAQTYCYNSVWQGSGWTSTSFTVSSPPTSSVSVSPNPVPYGGNPGITLGSTNGYYCHVYVDWANVASGYFTSGTYYPGAQYSPGTHSAQTYCYNSVWAGSGWTSTSFTVSSPPTASVSISQNPVPYGGNPTFTLSSTNAYYCYLWVDGTYLVNGYTTSGSFNYGAFTSPGSHYMQAYCYNSVWAGSGWSGAYFNVDSPPTSSLSVSPNPVPYNSAPTFTLSSTNAYYCHVLMDGVWDWNVSGYFGSGSFSPPAMTSPGSHSAWSYCYNSVWQNPNGWSISYFTVDAAPTASITSVSPDPVPYGGNPAFTLSTTNGYYSYVLMDGVWNWYTGGYFTSGNYSPGALTSPGSHSAWGYTYNSAWAGSGWGTRNFTVSSPPTSSVAVSPNPVTYGTNPGVTLSSTNGYYCYVRVDGADLPGTPGYFTSGTFYPGAQTTPGAHTASSYCYNSVWSGSGWTSTPFTVGYAPISSVSCTGAPGSPYVNQPVTWSSAVSGGSGSFAYAWSGTDGLSGTGASASKSYVASGTKLATVAVTDAVSGETSSASCNGGGGVSVSSCTGSLAASPGTVAQGQNVTLTWNVAGGASCAASCAGSGFNTGGAISGSAPSSAPPAPPTTSYALTCSGGSYGPPPPVNTTVTVLTPAATLSVNGQSSIARVNAATPNNATVVWSSTDATSCAVTKNGAAWRTGLSSPGVTDSVTIQTAYTLDCENDYGTHATATVTVNVVTDFTEF